MRPSYLAAKFDAVFCILAVFVWNLAVANAETPDGGRNISDIPFSLVTGGEWSLCRMEHTVIGPLSIGGVPAPMHHLALPMGSRRLRMGIVINGRLRRPSFDQDEIITIEAGSDGQVWWDDPFESACFYFAPGSVAMALGEELGDEDVNLHTSAGLHAPVVVHLLRALHGDAMAGQPHGRMVGDTIFAALAAQFVSPRRSLQAPAAADWRVRRALDYIHAHLTDPIDLPMIAAAAATSHYHLSRSFREATGYTIWRYVLSRRARRAQVLIRESGLSLTEVAYASGFETYSSFVAAIRQEFGTTPMAFKRGIRCPGLGR